MNSKYKNRTIIILPILFTVGIFYSSNLDQDISGIETRYVIETNTLNNSFITLDIVSQQNDESYQEMRNALKIQMEQFNARYDQSEKERQKKKNVKSWVDGIVYILLLTQVIITMPKSSSDIAKQEDSK